MAKRHYLDHRRLPEHVRRPAPEGRIAALAERRGSAAANPAPTQSQSQLALVNSSRSSGLSASGAAGQWPGPDPTGLPIPNMPKISDNTPPLWSLGASGVSIFGGIITSEEYNPDFYWRKGIEIYEQMTRNDGQIIAIRQMLELPLRRATWSIQPGSADPQDQEIASFIDTCLFHDMRYQTATGRILCQTWDDILRQALCHLFFGFFPFELNYRIDDGWVKWARWTPLLPRTVWRWWVGPDAELAGIQQWTWRDYNYVYVDIPADKLLLFVNRQEGNNYEGFSLLRPCYKHWWYKTNFEKIDAIGIERNAVVPPIIYLPPNFTPADVKAAGQIGANMRANEQMYVTVPSTWVVEYPRNWQKYAAQTMTSIQYHDIMIARAVLCQFINLGSTETGAYALADSQTKTFLQALQAVGKYIEETVNYEIQRLVDYNYDDVAVYPRLVCSKLAAADIDDVATSLAKLAAGPVSLITPDPPLEDFLREQMGIPAAVRSTVQATNPTAPSDPARPENANAADHTDSEPDDTKTPPTSVTPGSGLDGAGSPTSGDGGGAVAASIVEESRLLREAFAAITGLDAVDRGLRHAAVH